MPKSKRVHWFDGDGMVHAFRLKDGKIFYCNRYTMTPHLEQEFKAERAQGIRLGEMVGLAGLFKLLLYELQRKIGYMPFLQMYHQGSANTAFCHHQKRTYALMEADLPFHIKIDRSEKNFDIKSISFDNFNGQLKHNVSAHPKVDRKTGELMAFGYDMMSKTPCVHYSLINKDRKVISSLDCPITSARMIHDFGATENHVIIPDLPLLFDAGSLAQGKSVFAFDKKAPARYGIMKRLNQDLN